MLLTSMLLLALQCYTQLQIKLPSRQIMVTNPGADHNARLTLQQLAHTPLASIVYQQTSVMMALLFPPHQVIKHHITSQYKSGLTLRHHCPSCQQLSFALLLLYTPLHTPYSGMAVPQP
ncbi:hypothetical protein COO60DRAFT_1170467 [Scenedesmus sp. NREL 46B-D3]|nr:hypothetical protein COO60DRAFT_1170467 [Scenedesmus sp. NREL 46B-D3]